MVNFILLPFKQGHHVFKERLPHVGIIRRDKEPYAIGIHLILNISFLDQLHEPVVPFPGKVFHGQPEHAALAGIFLQRSREIGVEISDTAKIIGIVSTLGMTAQINNVIVDLQGDIRNRTVLAHPAGSQLSSQGVGKKPFLQRHLSTRGGKLNRRGKGGHGAVIGETNRPGILAVFPENIVEVGQLPEIQLIIDFGIIPDSSGFIDLTADNLVIHHHIGKTKPQGIKASFLFGKAGFGFAASPFHELVVRILFHSLGDQLVHLFRNGLFMEGHRQPHRHEPAQEFNGVYKLAGFLELGGKPVVLLHAQNLATANQSQFDVGASDIDS